MIFCQSLRSDWNHGHAHFLRGVVVELLTRGATVEVYEPLNSWSASNLVLDHGSDALTAYATTYPTLPPTLHRYDTEGLVDDAALDAALGHADLVLVQEWIEPGLARRIGRHRSERGDYTLLFHDAHHRAVSDKEHLERMELHRYDGVLAFGESLKERYLEEALAENVHVWHEAADTRVFAPRPPTGQPRGDLVWIGNWGDDERHLETFLLDPIHALGLDAMLYGVRYPPRALRLLDWVGARYGGYLPNAQVPEVFARHSVTAHVPRRIYLDELAGIPTIRMFEAMACGIPVVVAQWEDTERLFSKGRDHLVAETGEEMRDQIQALLEEPALAERLRRAGLRTILDRHTVTHRVDELLEIVSTLEQRKAAHCASHPFDLARPLAPPAAPPVVATANGFAGLRSAPARPSRADGSGRRDGFDVAFFGSSLLSTYWNGAATYYRGLLRALSEVGWNVTFYEPDAFDRPRRQDFPAPKWAEVVIYPARDVGDVERVLGQARASEPDLVVKASGIGRFDDLLSEGVLRMRSPGTRVAYWDVDAPATLRSLEEDGDPLARLVPEFDIVFTYGGGPPVVERYVEHGARRCVPIYNALDPETHHPVAHDPRFACDIAFLGNRLPDREHRVEEFFLGPASRAPERRFLLGGSGWQERELPTNVRHLGHVPSTDHNAFNTAPLAVLNVHRESMSRVGFSPATRVFEAAGAGACLITDPWEGIERFLRPGSEVLVAADGDEVLELLDGLTPERAEAIGARAREHLLREHTYAHRARDVAEALRSEGVTWSRAEARS